MALVNDCIGLRLSTIGDKTQKDKQKKTLQHEAKKAAEHQKREGHGSTASPHIRTPSHRWAPSIFRRHRSEGEVDTLKFTDPKDLGLLVICLILSQLKSENQETMTTKFKLILGGILLLFGIIFAMQNSTVVEVRFLVWSVQMSQALVIFLTGAVGTTIGFLFGTAFKISRQSWDPFGKR
jgi:uncharacterized integral membrane protein